MPIKITGDFTIADAMYAPVILRFRTYEVSLDPISQACAETIVSLPTLQEWLQAAESETMPQYEL